MPITTQRILDSGGKPLSVTRTADVWSSGGPCLALPRAALHTALRDSLRDTNLHFGTSITGIEQCGATSLATFSDGTTSEYDLVIGADGINSYMRQSLFPDVRPSYTGNVCWRFITRDIVGVEGWTAMLGDRMSLLVMPVGDEQVYVYADIAMSEQEAQRNLTDLPHSLRAAFSSPVIPVHKPGARPEGSYVCFKAYRSRNPVNGLATSYSKGKSSPINHSLETKAQQSTSRIPSISGVTSPRER